MMRKNERVQPLNLEAKVPTFFRCPISLDVMRSPVSLCTGVTYDRSSIQRWIDSGNNTCPATMQPLPSTDLVPNLTLRRLIHHWNASASASPVHPAADIFRNLGSSQNPAPILRHLAEFLLDSNTTELDKNGLIEADILTEVIFQNVGRIDTLEAAAAVIHLILSSDFVDQNKKKILLSSLISDLNTSTSALLSVIKDGNTLESRIDAAWILDAILSSTDADARSSIALTKDLIPELIRLISEDGDMNGSAIETGLSCLVWICGVRRARLRMVKEGIVAATTKLLSSETVVLPMAAAEKALRLLEAAVGTPEGRSAICVSAEECLEAVMRRMIKVGKEGMESAVMVMWSVCHRFRDRRAVEAVAAANGGVTKILLLMQSNCSPSARQMAGDLLRFFRVNSKSCLSGYDTKTTHIMPF
ncbi:hypothetical protein HPP92_026216 [Vanilla planifolia]|uniref:U-box domain-containing protein n=1 Tax=Vanilla planifolia TaxID=51239 RepID=A0A835PGV5_VANPL|nr:hypothetical protein HPP92_026216 [Vanilla planifolia]